MAGGASRRSGRGATRWWADLQSRMSTLLRLPSVRYSLLGLAAVAVLIGAVTQMASVIVDQWSQQDVELRARLVYRSIRDRVVIGLAAKPEGDLQPFFERLAEDERLLALGFCNSRGEMLYATKEMPSGAHCPKTPLPKLDTFEVLHDQQPPIALAFFPLASKEADGSLLVVHDLSSSTGGRTRPNLHGARPHRRRRWAGAARRRRSCSRCSRDGPDRSARRSLIQSRPRRLGPPARRNCRSGATSRRCCPNSGWSDDTLTASMSSGRRRRCINFSTRSCRARR